MNPNPYQSPRRQESRASARRLRPYLLFNGVLIGLHLLVALFPFVVPNVNVTNVSLDGSTTSFQFTPLKIEGTFASLVLTVLIFVVPNAAILIIQTVTAYRARTNGAA